MTDGWTDEDAAMAAIEGMEFDQPVRCAHIFMSAFTRDQLITAHGAVTPESLES